MLTTAHGIDKNEHLLIVDEIHERIKLELNSKDKIYFSYSISSKRDNSPPTIVTNYPPEWINNYFEMALYKIDPVLIMAQSRILSFSWNESIFTHTGNDACNLFNKSRKYNIVRGYSFPLHDYQDNVATLSLYAETNSEAFERQVISHSSNLHSLLLTVHNRYLSEKAMLSRTHDASREKKLTSREIEALHWASIGKTYREIAIIMGITESTVKFHIGNLRVKLDVANAKHAIKRASDLRLFPAANGR